MGVTVALKGTHRNDIKLIAGLLLAAGILALFLHFTRRQGGSVRIEQDGVTTAVLPLDQDTRKTIEQDGAANVLVIENGAVWVEEANCRDKICVRQGAIRYTGQSIVCLPHKLVITIEGGSDTPFDAQTR